VGAEIKKTTTRLKEVKNDKNYKRLAAETTGRTGGKNQETKTVVAFNRSEKYGGEGKSRA
jgi:hypothetical protein